MRLLSQEELKHCAPSQTMYRFLLHDTCPPSLDLYLEFFVFVSVGYKDARNASRHQEDALMIYGMEGGDCRETFRFETQSQRVLKLPWSEGKRQYFQV